MHFPILYISRQQLGDGKNDCIFLSLHLTFFLSGMSSWCQKLNKKKMKDKYIFLLQSCQPTINLLFGVEFHIA